ncbi:MAG: sigma-54-dependent Fis family transcriptional regulator [Candidatus Saganbacteria bacterium]|nr:sigma-54-dependent Fis family transcriptional regulator [Candidatus Saganbacteria bacterium]
MAEAKPRILAVDDEQDMLETFRSILGKKYKPLTATSGKKAISLLKKEPIPLVLLDIRMPKEDGIKVLQKIKAWDENIEVIMVTASKDVSLAVSAMKLGAFDYITKPFDVLALLATISKALEKRALVFENLYLKEALDEATSYCDLIGKTPPMKKLYEMIGRAAPTNSTILIQGESGVGKELVARAIHTKSRRQHKPFIVVNCAALPENLLESLLFGHERGSFTGALERKIGKFELADGGTLFLDEIGCMSFAMQAKLLRVLENKQVERLGGEKNIPIDVRVLSATNIDFKKEIKAKTFRTDLYYRLNVIPLYVPALCERKADIPLLINHFIKQYNKELNKKVTGFSSGTINFLTNYSWPGNVRELSNLVERAIVLSKGKTINAQDLFLSIEQSTKKNPKLRHLVDNFEKETITKAVAQNRGSVTSAAKSLKTPRSTLMARMKALGIAFSKNLR